MRRGRGFTTRRAFGNRPLAPGGRATRDRALIGPTGSRSQRPMARPWAGKAARSTVACSRIRRLFMDTLPSATHVPIVTGSQPRSRAMRGASRRRRSAVAMRSPISTSSVFSLDRGGGLGGPDARRRSRSLRAPHRWRRRPPARQDPAAASIERCRHRLRHRRVAGIQQSIEVSAAPPKLEVEADLECAQTRRSVPIVRPSAVPCSNRDTEVRGTAASLASSSCVRRLRMRSDRTTEPSRTMSTCPSLDGPAHPALIDGYPAGRGRSSRGTSQ